MLAYEHNNSSNFVHDFDDLDRSNREENRRGLPNILSNYRSAKNVYSMSTISV